MNYISSTTFGFVNGEDEARMINFNRGYIRGYGRNEVRYSGAERLNDGNGQPDV